MTANVNDQNDHISDIKVKKQNKKQKNKKKTDFTSTRWTDKVGVNSEWT